MYKLSEILSILKSKRTQIISGDLEISHLLIDSRKLLFPENSLFFAFLGQQTDGHLFIDDLYNRGVRSFVIENPDYSFEKYPKANFILVEKCREAIQEIAAFHRKNSTIPILGLTGSNGKTIIKEWIYQLLEHKYDIVRSPGSYNSQLGVPLSVWQIDNKTDLAIIEAGISRKGEMKSLANIIAPTIGIFTNLGDAHSSGFSSKEEKLKEKIQLFRESDTIIYDADEAISTEVIERDYASKRLLSWSFKDENASFYIRRIEHHNGFSKIQYKWKNEDHDFSIPFKDAVSTRMAIFAVIATLLLGREPEEIKQDTMLLSAINMRLEVKDGINNCMLINDSYNADLTSFTQALHFLSMQDKSRDKVLILSDFFQMGMSIDDLNTKLAALINKQELAKLILIGTQVRGIAKLLNSEVKSYIFDTTREMISSISSLELSNMIILLKGARKFKFEEIFVRLSRHYHNTVLEINLDSMVQNLHVYRSFLKAETKVMAVIKASGYGAGSVKLAKHLEKNTVNYFAVAFMDEGIELRKGGIETPIMVFSADPNFLSEMIEYRLEPVVFSFEYLKRISEFAPDGLGIHIKIDSGLNRLGFQEKELDSLCNELVKLKNIRVLSIYSHFSASPTDKYDSFSHRQAKVFNKAYELIVSKLGYRPIQHLLNSAGVVKFPEYQFDMVRMGSGLHGIDTSNKINNALQVVHTLKARINMIKYVKEGDSVGYERMGITDKIRKIAIIPIGYADGLVRRAGNENYSVYLNGHYAPIVGNVNMDLTMIDISSIPNVETGDEVEIFGAKKSIQDLAKSGDTIFYEILSRISPRVKRIYTTS